MREAHQAQVEAMDWPILEPLEGDLDRPVALSKGVCVAGARRKVNLPLPSPMVSRAHALFVAGEDGVYLRDLASRNRVYLNDAPVREAGLNDGDVIRIGPYTFRCRSGFTRTSADDRTAAPAALHRLDDNSEFRMQGRTTVLGARRECDVRVAGDEVEPVHAVVFERAGRWFVRDLRSRTGTFVNDAAVGQIELHEGDVLRIGKSQFRYESPEAPASISPAEAPAAETPHDAGDSDAPIPVAEPIAVENDELWPGELASIETEPAADLAPNVAPPVDVGAVSTPGIPVVRSETSPEEPLIQVDEPIPVDASIPLEDSVTKEEDVVAVPEPLNASGPQDVPEAAETSSTAQHPGQPEPRPAEEAFSQVLEVLTEKVEQVQQVVEQVQSSWREMKTSPESPQRRNNPDERSGDHSPEARGPQRAHGQATRH